MGTDVKELAERLRDEMGSIGGPSYTQMMQQRLEAASALEAQAEEIARLREMFRADGDDHAKIIRDLSDRHETRITKYADAIAALKAENERLREALQPFAAEAGEWGDAVPDSHHPVFLEPGHWDARYYGSAAKFTVGDQRGARAALHPTQGGE